MKRVIRFVSFIVLGLAACSSQAMTPTQTSTSANLPTITPSPTTIPTSTPTLTPSPTPYPWPQESISAENFPELSLLGEWGKGSIKSLSSVGNGDAFYAETLTKLIFFDTETLDLLFEIPKPIDFKFSPTYRFLIGVDSSGAVSLGSLVENISYSLETTVLTDHYTFSFSPSEDLVAVARFPNGNVRPEFHTINVYDTSSGSLVAVLDHGDYSPVPETIIFSPNSQYLLVQEYGYRKRLGIWDVSEQRMITRFLDRTDISDQPFSPDGSVFATYSDNFVFFWETRTGSGIGEYGTGLGYTYDLEFSEDGDYVRLNQGDQVRAVSDGELLTKEEATDVSFPEQLQAQSALTDLENQKEWLESQGYFGANGQIRLTGAGELEVWMPSIDIVWNPILESVQSLKDLDYPAGQIYFSGDEVLVWVCEDSGLSLFSSSSMSSIKFGVCDRDTRVAISGKSAAVALVNGSIIELYNAKDGELMSTLRAHETEIQSVAFSEDGNLLASFAGKDLFIWDLQGEVRRSHTLAGVNLIFSPLAFSPSNEFLVINQGGGSLGVWRLSDGQKLRDLENPVSVASLSFSADGLLMIAGSDGNLYFWDVAKTTLLHSIRTNQGRLSDFRMLIDDKGILTVSTDGVVKLWGLDR